MMEVIDCRGLTLAITALRLKQRLIYCDRQPTRLCALVENSYLVSELGRTCPDIADRIQIVAADQVSISGSLTAALQRFDRANA